MVNYNLIFLDTETTGNTEKDRLMQVCFKNKETGEIQSELFLPPVPVTIEAMEVTNITPKMLIGKIPFQGSEMFKQLELLFSKEENVLVAHNAPFDLAMLEKEGIKVKNFIDTLKIARFLDPNAKLSAYRLQYLRYLLDLDSEITEPIIPHDAKGDVLVLEKLFIRLFNKMKEIDKLTDNDILQKMITTSLAPLLVPRFTFGKYKGQLIKEVAEEDKKYLEWLFKQKMDNPDSDRDTDLIYTLEYYLDKK